MKKCAFHTREAGNKRISRLPHNQCLPKFFAGITLKASAQCHAKEKRWKVKEQLLQQNGNGILDDKLFV